MKTINSFGFAYAVIVLLNAISHKKNEAPAKVHLS